MTPTYKVSKKAEKLIDAFQTLKTSPEFVSFLRDLLTEPEIEEFADRLAVAKALSEGKSQRVVAKETGISIATVTRVNQWVTKGMGGYKIVLSRLQKKPTKNSILDKHRTE